MRIVIPIRGLVSDDSFSLNEIEFVSNFQVQEYFDSLVLNTSVPKNKNTLLTEITRFNIDWYKGCLLAIYDEKNLSQNEILNFTHDQAITFIQSVADKIIRTLDILRIYNVMLQGKKCSQVIQE